MIFSTSVYTSGNTIGLGLFVEDEALLGFVEAADFDEDETFGFDDAEEPLSVDNEPPVLDAAEELLSVSCVDKSKLLVSAEDAVLDELLSAVEAASFCEELLSKLIVVIEVAGRFVFEQPVIRIAAAEASPAHIIFFMFNTLSHNRRSQQSRQQTKPNPLTAPLQ